MNNLEISKQARKAVSRAENIVLTIKVLLGAGVILAAIFVLDNLVG